MEPLILFTVGVCFDGTSIWAGEVDSGGYYPRPAARSRVEVIEAVGSPEEVRDGQSSHPWRASVA